MPDIYHRDWDPDEDACLTYEFLIEITDHDSIETVVTKPYVHRNTYIARNSAYGARPPIFHPQSAMSPVERTGEWRGVDNSLEVHSTRPPRRDYLYRIARHV